MHTKGPPLKVEDSFLHELHNESELRVAFLMFIVTDYMTGYELPNLEMDWS
jgi:hypothetical protein